MIKIKQSNWLARIYMFNYDHLDDRPAPMETDVCHFIQVILFVVPLKLFFIALAFGVPLVGVLYFFFEIIPSISMTLHYAIWTTIVMLIVAYYVGERIDEWRGNRPPRPAKEPSLLVQYIKAKKRKICPLVEIVPPPSDDDCTCGREPCICWTYTGKF